MPQTSCDRPPRPTSHSQLSATAHRHRGQSRWAAPERVLLKAPARAVARTATPPLTYAAVQQTLRLVRFGRPPALRIWRAASHGPSIATAGAYHGIMIDAIDTYADAKPISAPGIMRCPRPDAQSFPSARTLRC